MTPGDGVWRFCVPRKRHLNPPRRGPSTFGLELAGASAYWHFIPRKLTFRK